MKAFVDWSVQKNKINVVLDAALHSCSQLDFAEIIVFQRREATKKV